MKISCFFCDYLAVLIFAGSIMALAQFERASAAHAASDHPSMNHPERDRAAIVESTENIAQGVDLHQWSSVVASLAPVVQLDTGTARERSAESLVALWRALVEPFTATQHVLTNFHVEINDHDAEVHSRFHATYWLRDAEGGDFLMLEGLCEHGLIRTPDGWRVSMIKILRQAASGNRNLREEAARRRSSQPVQAAVAASPGRKSDAC